MTGEELYEKAYKIALISGASMNDVIGTFAGIAFSGNRIDSLFSSLESNNWRKMHGYPKRRKTIKKLR